MSFSPIRNRKKDSISFKPKNICIEVPYNNNIIFLASKHRVKKFQKKIYFPTSNFSTQTNINWQFQTSETRKDVIFPELFKQKNSEKSFMNKIHSFKDVFSEYRHLILKGNITR